jgi:hypothetical protein
MKVICVYKTGGDYSYEYVHRLHCVTEDNLTIPHDFLCLTDDPRVTGEPIIRLKHDWPGWWSKIELFRPDLPDDDYLYLDLDTLILKNIDRLAEAATKVDFAMLRAFRSHHGTERPISGIMMGRFRNHARIYETFVTNPDAWIRDTAVHGRGPGMKGDQGFIGKMMTWNVPKIQDLVPEGYVIHKFHWNELGKIPENAHVLEWSGKPRLHVVLGEIGEIWRGINESVQ